MAQWDNLGNAATIAQLAGVDALGLISTILQAAQMVRHNRETCLELGQDLQRVESLLNLLKESETMKKEEIKNVLNGLDRTLKEADSLVKSCRDCSLAYRIFMGWKQSDQFRRVKKKINKHLRFYDMISHAVIIRRMEEFAKSAQSSSSSQQDAQEVWKSSTNSQNPEARKSVGTPVEIEIEPVKIEIEPVKTEMTQAGTQFTTVEEHQQAGNNLNNGSWPSMKWRFGDNWPRTVWTKRKVETVPFICELTVLGLKFFQYTQLYTATDNFAPRYKIEGWGPYAFYKGKLPDGLDIMIKREPHLDTSDSELSVGFKNEFRFLSKLQHKNIVKLIGCCTERGEAILVYEYMANGRLSDIITGGTGTGRFLDWSERFKIIIGIAHGLLYLHECCGMCITHGDLIPRSILLDSDMAPKITDFSNARKYDPDEHGSSIHDPRGYSVRRSDVFSFGLTLLEIITAKSRHEHYDNEASDPLTVEGIAQKMDPAMEGEPRAPEIMRCIQVALLCVVTDQEERPSMWDVLLMLSCESAVIPEVPRPRSEITQHPEASGSGWAQFNDAGELSDSDIVEPR